MKCATVSVDLRGMWLAIASWSRDPYMLIPVKSLAFSDPHQVWSLTQFYSVDFHNPGSVLQKCVFNKRTIKVCISCCWRCPGTSAPRATHLKVSLYLCSSGSNARGESRAREGRRVSSKSPSRVRDGDEGVAGRNGQKLCFPDEGSLIYPPGKSMFFYKKETEKKNELEARPVFNASFFPPWGSDGVSLRKYGLG